MESRAGFLKYAVTDYSSAEARCPAHASRSLVDGGDLGRGLSGLVGGEGFQGLVIACDVGFSQTATAISTAIASSESRSTSHQGQASNQSSEGSFHSVLPFVHGRRSANCDSVIGRGFVSLFDGAYYSGTQE
jgi:hypothetical protein